MNKCIICNKEILKDSQYINGDYYHNNCIMNLQQQLLQKDKIIDECIKYIKEKYYEDYGQNDNYIPIEKLNLKNCTYERSLVVLDKLIKTKNDE